MLCKACLNVVEEKEKDAEFGHLYPSGSPYYCEHCDGYLNFTEVAHNVYIYGDGRKVFG